MANAKKVIAPTMAEMIATAVAAAMADQTPAKVTKAVESKKIEKPEIKFLELEIGASVEATLKNGTKIVVGRSKRGLTYVKLA